VHRDLDFISELYQREPELVLNGYHMVRYEDLARRPVVAAKRIYEFLEREPDEQLKKWVAGISGGARIQNSHHAARKTAGSEVNLVTFLMAKDAAASDVHREWMSGLDAEAVRMVQEDCEDVMYSLGYEPVDEEYEQAEDEDDIKAIRKSYIGDCNHPILKTLNSCVET